MDWSGDSFWAKTTGNNRPGISLRDHRLNVGCVTSNKIHERVVSFLARIEALPQTLRLAHGTARLHDDFHVPTLVPALIGDRLPSAANGRDDDEGVTAHEHVRVARSWFASCKRALLAPFGVGTADQALLGIVAAKHFFVRQCGLAGKVVILDEIHTYDLYTGTLLDKLVQRLRDLRCTVLILSATLTAQRREELPGDIRPLLEATYREAAADEPPGWTELARGIEDRRRSLRQAADLATLVRRQPALADEEGVQTNTQRPHSAWDGASPGDAYDDPAAYGARRPVWDTSPW